MIILSLFSWWYTTGWLTLARKCADRVRGLLQFFSVPLLLGSLFAPFRQISSEHVDGPIGVQLAALGDRIFSRVIGAIVRSFLIVVGAAAVLIFGMFCIVIMLGWPLVPAAPLIGLLFGRWR